MVRRVTTGGMMKSYRSGLYRSYSKLAEATERVTTERNFNSYAESPAKASQAFQLRHSRWNVENQIANSKLVTSKFQQGWDCLNASYEKLGHNMANYSTIVAFNGADASGRQALGQTIQGAADSMLLTMNAQFGGRFVFSGADGDTVPFEWKDNGDGTRSLTYRGMEVDLDPADPNYADLKATLDETTYVDLGMGMKEDANGNIIPSSAFNTALNGLYYLGYGTDADGDPKNLISIMNEIGDILQRCSAEDGKWATPQDGVDCERLWGKMTDALDELHSKWVEHDVNSRFVKENQTRLESLDDSYNEQITGIEDIDPAEAITALMWAQYSYNAALRIGNGILSQSLIDYMS